MAEITYNDLDNVDTPLLMFCKTSSANFNQVEVKFQEHQSALTHNYPNILHTQIVDVILSKGQDGSIYPNWSLLNNRSNCNPFMNNNYLRNTRKAENVQVLFVNYNAGKTSLI